MTLGHVFCQGHIDGFSVKLLLDCQQYREETSSTVTNAQLLSQQSIPPFRSSFRQLISMQSQIMTATARNRVNGLFGFPCSSGTAT